MFEALFKLKIVLMALNVFKYVKAPLKKLTLQIEHFSGSANLVRAL